MLVVARGASKPKVCCSQCHQTGCAFPGLSGTGQLCSCVFIAVATFKQNLLSVSQDDRTLLEDCGDKSSANIFFVVGWLFSHYFQLPSLGLALY